MTDPTDVMTDKSKKKVDALLPLYHKVVEMCVSPTETAAVGAALITIGLQAMDGVVSREKIETFLGGSLDKLDELRGSGSKIIQ